MATDLDLIALCKLTNAEGQRCDWGVLARHLRRHGLADTLSGVAAIAESGKRAETTGWVIATRSDQDWDRAIREAEAELAVADQCGASMTSVGDVDYPINLWLVDNLPPFLFYQGNLDAEADCQSVAVVGTRTATEPGLGKAAKMARQLSEMDITVTSGLAAGIDTAAHRATVESGGRTIAVFGTGISQVYPKENRGLAAEILESGGLVVSQFFPSASPAPWTFRRRNEVTSGISQGTVVIEASGHSGAKMQARIASEHGKRVFLIKSLVTSESWASEMVERGTAIEVSIVDEVAQRIAQPERIATASGRLFVPEPVL